MTKRLTLAAVALALTAGCGDGGANGGSADPADREEDPGRADDAGSKKDARTSSGKDGSSETASNCRSGDDDDKDGDGFTVSEGDCNDCRAEVNPGAFDFPNDAVDDDCSGEAASVGNLCDEGLALDSSDPKDGARALGLCSFTTESSRAWGVINARYTDASGSGRPVAPLAKGILPAFGTLQPSAGESFLALSSGVARAPDQAGYTPQCDFFDTPCDPVFQVFCPGGQTPPPGYPKESSSCGAGANIFDTGSVVFNQAALELTIRVPNNVKSLSFDSIFYTSEYPKYVCSSYNDFYVVFKEPKPQGVEDGNIVFDVNGDPIGVNTGLLAVCDPEIQDPTTKKRFACEQGTELLKGTGYGAGETGCTRAGNDGGASTGWLHTTAPVEPGQVITLRFAIWDTEDPDLDSTIVVDNFTWSPEEADVGTAPIVI